MFKVQEGFGPIDDGIKKCWGVRTTRMTFPTQADAEAFSEARYDKRVARLQRHQPDWWKSYWTRVVPAQ